MKQGKLASLKRRACAMVALALIPCAAQAEDPVPQPRPTHNLFGMTGLIDLPSADMQPDGQLTATAGYFHGFLRNTVSAQFLPGVEVAFRYSILEDLSVNSDLFDRSFDAKIRLLQETDKWPAVAIGLQDFLGTGVFSSEYLVATKGFETETLGTFSITGGLGWGRYATQNGVRNPLSAFQRFESRDDFEGTGGNVDFGRYFSGDNVGIFGGIEWRTPIEDLTVKVEYSPDRYDRERGSARFEQEVPINFGMEYRPIDGVEVGAYYMYGTEIGVRLSISGNPFRPIVDQDLEPAPQPLRQRPAIENEQLAALGAIADMITGEAPVGYFSDKRLRTVIVHNRLGDVRWAEASLAEGAGANCPEGLAAAIDAEYGVVDVVTFSTADGVPLCTVALRPAGQHAIRMTSRVHASYPTDWYRRPEQRQQLIEILSEELSVERIGLLGIEIAPRRVRCRPGSRSTVPTPLHSPIGRALARHLHLRSG
ncbi:MAG: YjbH domain-containing protein [Paracoccaceae bacterium]